VRAVHDVRADSAIADLQQAVDALTCSRQRYLGREAEPRFAEVPSLLDQLRGAAGEAGPGGGSGGKPGSRPPLDIPAYDLHEQLRREIRQQLALVGLRPGVDLAAAVRLLARVGGGLDYSALERLVARVTVWRARVEAMFPETKSIRDLPDLSCSRCRVRRVVEVNEDGDRMLVAALHYVAGALPGIQCRKCGHLYHGETALRALAASQGSERAGAA
jgi:hypothetical protein